MAVTFPKKREREKERAHFEVRSRSGLVRFTIRSKWAEERGDESENGLITISAPEAAYAVAVWPGNVADGRLFVYQATERFMKYQEAGEVATPIQWGAFFAHIYNFKDVVGAYRIPGDEDLPDWRREMTGCFMFSNTGCEK